MSNFKIRMYEVILFLAIIFILVNVGVLGKSNNVKVEAKLFIFQATEKDNISTKIESFVNKEGIQPVDIEVTNQAGMTFVTVKYVGKK